ncbi:lytic transglycosylase domain-containing protein [Streptosporangium sp. NPDC051023]|uniref:aggregation-promoting factor C-terminal-like domain-containing protein n=1 Tax=Streptosporangium sp. NPDC051023 TaxID=3155410 RepID=UPI00344F473D
MNSYRVLRNTVLTMLAASTVIGSAAIGRAEDISTAESVGLTEEVGTAEGVGLTEEVGTAEGVGLSEEVGTAEESETTEGIRQAEESAASAARSSARRIHRAVWFTRARPKVRAVAGTSRSRNKAIAFRLVSRRSWSQNQFQCLDSLWTRESNWDHEAHNPSSGAYGIPQALPGSKMSGMGVDWRSNPITQIHWGLRYIKSRYGSPCGAWGHFRSSNWY